MIQNFYLTLGAIGHSSFLLLMRDKGFWGLVGVIGLGMLFAFMVAGWTIEKNLQILFDLLTVILKLGGGAWALVAGSDLLGVGSKESRGWEVQLLAPIPQSRLVLGKFVGMGLQLVILAGIVILFGAGLMGIYESRGLNLAELRFFCAHLLSWLVIGALALFWGSFCRRNLALFASLGLWVCGLISHSVTAALPADSPQWEKILLRTLSFIWDLQRFDIQPDQQILASTLAWIFAYGCGIIVFCLAGGYLIMQRKYGD